MDQPIPRPASNGADPKVCAHVVVVVVLLFAYRAFRTSCTKCLISWVMKYYKVSSIVHPWQLIYDTLLVCLTKNQFNLYTHTLSTLDVLIEACMLFLAFLSVWLASSRGYLQLWLWDAVWNGIISTPGCLCIDEWMDFRKWPWLT